LKDLSKQCATWKPHNHNLVTWVFYQINNNQHIDFTQNQIMHCIICHQQIIGPKIVAINITSRKRFIAYHKSNAITAMKKHIEMEHNNLLKRYVEKINNSLDLHLNVN
jgi:hypothetical protein